MSKVLDLKYKESLTEKFNTRTAMEEASRCLLCHDAPCSASCPAATDPGSFIQSIRFKNVKGAAETIRTNNALGGSCSLICPHDKLCEGACSRTGIDKPIQIGRLQEFAVEQEKIFDMRILEAPKEKNGLKVACVGSGPASLTCAVNLALEGYEVTVLEADDKIGGILTNGINPSRINRELVDYDIEKIKDLGVNFVLNTKIEGMSGVKELKEEYDAVHVGVGLSESKKVDSDIIDYRLSGVRSALEFLKDARNNDGEISIGEYVIVIGGGDVAMDCAITAKQLGAKNVSIVYRRSISEAPANIDELSIVQNMGISIITPFKPEKTISENGKLTGMSFKSRDEYSELNIKADTLIVAIGQEASEDFKDFAIEDGIFASGDLVNKGETVVQAVYEGKLAADEINKYLSKKGVKVYG